MSARSRVQAEAERPTSVLELPHSPERGGRRVGDVEDVLRPLADREDLGGLMPVGFHLADLAQRPAVAGHDLHHGAVVLSS